MTSNMDVDLPAEKRLIEFHPLAIVYMSDQYTRITTGGSPLPKNSPVVGLLFGMISEVSSTKTTTATTPNLPTTTTTTTTLLSVLDADEISPTSIADASSSSRQQISLHQAVFPQHSVVGWYRVSTDATPTPEDVQTTLSLAQEFGSDIIFCFTQVNNTDATSLPMTLYQVEHMTMSNMEDTTPTTTSAAVLVAIDDEHWKLETSVAERIAVETVVRQQPEEVGYDSHVKTMEDAMLKLQDRLTIMIQFVQDTVDAKLPFDPSLMRQVQSVVMQLGPLVASKQPSSASSSSQGAEVWLPHLAVAAKIVQAIQGYAEKVRAIELRIGTTRGRF